MFDFDSYGIYLGGGINPRLMFGDMANSGVRVLPYVQVGGLFFRQARTQMFVELRGAQNVIPDQVYDGGYIYDVNGNLAGRREYFPTEVGLTIGIGW
jgi:hypothetical protein